MIRNCNRPDDLETSLAFAYNNQLMKCSVGPGRSSIHAARYSRPSLEN